MSDQRRIAFQFIILMGLVSLFGDITYEGVHSVTGPFLVHLGASAAVVGLVAGLGGFLGYALRLVSGVIADRTKAYWPLTILGYGLIFSIPLLAFTHHWYLAAMFIILERVGKAIRTPARDTILSYATKQVGRGWGFAIHEVMDQMGAIIGPLLFSLVFLLKGGYRQGFTILWIPAFLTLTTLIITQRKVRIPEHFESLGDAHKHNHREGGRRLSGIFWLYALFTFLCVSGFANFQIISYHFKTKGIISDIQIPVWYAMAMAVDGLMALIIGKTYDKMGLRALLALPLLTIPIPFFAFSQSYGLVVIGVLLWGAVMGIHETIMRAAIADLTPIDKRGSAYGIFNIVYGSSWFLGSILMGLLYEVSIGFISIFVVIVELVSLPVFFVFKPLYRTTTVKYN